MTGPGRSGCWSTSAVTGVTRCACSTGVTCAGWTCSYHGWSYGTDGRLISVPEEQEFYHGALEKDKWGLEEAAVVNFCGLVFASLNRDGAGV